MSKLHKEAEALNATISAENQHVFSLLSDRGKAIYFPKMGILSQTAEAKGKKINATIGIALEENGEPMCLPGVQRQTNLGAKEIVQYAPSFGIPSLREYWKQAIVRKNPSLAGAAYSNPVVTSGITHALSMAGYLFINRGDKIISPEHYWENYGLTLCNPYLGRMDTFKTFLSGGRGMGFNVEGLRKKLLGKGEKKIVLLNFPNNPSGYTPTVEEAEALSSALKESAEAGKNIVVLCDDAYFGLVYADGIFKESLFSKLAQAHERILAVKIDGATKEDFAWGLRVGFITFGAKQGTAQLYGALENKTGGAIRGNISNASMLSQSVIINAYQSEGYEQSKKEKAGALLERHLEVKRALAEHPEYAKVFEPLPFNSGYFMCLILKKHQGEDIRQKLLQQFDTGVIAQGKLLRIAFSSIRKESIGALFANIYNACML